MRRLSPLMTSFLLCFALIGCQEKAAEDSKQKSHENAATEKKVKTDKKSKVAARYHGWKTVSESGFSALQKMQKEKAIAVKMETGSLLKETLMGAMKEGGPVPAIGECQVAAPTIIGGEKAGGVRVGRTSHKLRNGKNKAPTWAADLVKNQVEIPIYRVSPEGTLGALFPIKTGAACLTCHGDVASFAEGVGEALAEKYPRDKATGFKEGELRGYFWLEVPEKS